MLFHPSARLLAYQYSVHLVSEGSGWPAKRQRPAFLLAYRSSERLHWQRLPIGLAQVLLRASGDEPLNGAIAEASAALGDDVDRGFIRSWLVNLRDRGAISGFPETRQ